MIIEDYIKQLIKIEVIENSDDFGYYPFHLWSENKDGTNDLNSLLLGGDVLSCYKRFKSYIVKNAKTIYMSVDFPAVEDNARDFVAVFSYVNGEVNCIAIPYNIKNGEVFPIIKEGKFINLILNQLNAVINN